MDMEQLLYLDDDINDCLDMGTRFLHLLYIYQHRDW
jgi:hypothetical protein